MDKSVKTAEIIQAGTLVPLLRPSVAVNLPVLYRRKDAAPSPTIFARLSELANRISTIRPTEIPQRTVSRPVKRVSRPKVRTYQRPSRGFD